MNGGYPTAYRASASAHYQAEMPAQAFAPGAGFHGAEYMAPVGAPDAAPAAAGGRPGFAREPGLPGRRAMPPGVPGFTPSRLGKALGGVGRAHPYYQIYKALKEIYDHTMADQIADAPGQLTFPGMNLVNICVSNVRLAGRRNLGSPWACLVNQAGTPNPLNGPLSTTEAQVGFATIENTTAFPDGHASARYRMVRTYQGNGVGATNVGMYAGYTVNPWVRPQTNRKLRRGKAIPAQRQPYIPNPLEYAPPWIDPRLDPFSLPIKKLVPPNLPDMPYRFRPHNPNRRANPWRSPTERPSSGYTLPPIAPPIAPLMPDIVIGPRPGTQRPRLRPPSHRFRPPRTNEKEKKAQMGSPAMRALFKKVTEGFGKVTEGIDILESIWGAIPGNENRSASPKKMLRDIWNNFDDIDWNEALNNLAKDWLEDLAIGAVNQKANEGLRATPGWDFGRGIGWGPANGGGYGTPKVNPGMLDRRPVW